MWYCSHSGKHTAREPGLGRGGGRRELKEPEGTNGCFSFNSNKLLGTKTKEETSKNTSGMFGGQEDSYLNSLQKNSEIQMQPAQLHENGEEAWGSLGKPREVLGSRLHVCPR